MPSKIRPLIPYVILLLLTLGVFKDMVFNGKVPVPADLLVGGYYPWYDYKWGYSVGVPIKNPVLSDVYSCFYVWKYLQTSILKQGIIPYWNPSSFSGTPMLETYHSSVLFPGNIFLLLNSGFGWSFFIMLSTFSAALFMYLYLSTVTKTIWSRLFGSVIFSLSGLMTTWAEFGTAVWALSFIPLVFIGIDKVIVSGQKKYFALISAGSVALILAGHVQIDIYAFILFFFYALLRFFQTGSYKRIALVLTALAIGVGMAGIQLLPSYDFFTRSIRTEEKFSQLFNYGLSHWTQLIRLWNADFFGNPTTRNTSDPFQYHEASSFLGTLAVPLIISLIIFSKRKSYIGFFSLVFTTSLIMITQNPIPEYIYSLNLPLFTYSSASRMLFMTTLSGSILAAVALEKLVSDRRFAKVCLFVSILLIAINVTSILSLGRIDFKVALKNSVLPLGLLVLLAAISRLTKFKRLVMIIVLITTAFDLTRYFQKYNPFVSSSILFPRTPTTNYLQNQPGKFRILRQNDALLPPNTWARYDLESIEGYDPLYLQTYGKFFHLVENTKYSNANTRYIQLDDFSPKYLNALNVKYILAIKPKNNALLNKFQAKIQSMNYPLVFEDGSTQVFENPQANSRAYFVSEYQIARDENDLALQLENASFDPATQTILFSRAELPVSNLPGGEVKQITYSPNSVTVDVDAQGASLLVLAESYSPGWRAYVDSRSTQVFRANGALQAIVVPGGVHKIKFYYAPVNMPLAVTVSGISLLITCFLLIRYNNQRNEIPA